MDLNSITVAERPASREGLMALARNAGSADAWLAGGTWLFSEPQPTLARLIDLSGLGWEPLVMHEGGLSISATCTVATLAGFVAPSEWRAASLIGLCCRSFLASFKIWNMATVGGNLCMSLPAGPMISLCAALDGTCVIWTPKGDERRLPVVDFVRGPRLPALEPGEILRSIEIPSAAFRARAAFRRASLTQLGRSGVLVIGTLREDGAFALTVTAATRMPIRLAFSALPDEGMLRDAVAAGIPLALYYDDMHGRPDWRRQVTFDFAEQIRRELAEGRAA
ncbi:FAD-binding molybdopterin dehydrogenase [Labrys miyagiensis]